jgi:hypothetical protein
MKRLNRKQVIDAIANIRAFKSHTGSMRGEISDGMYRVYSYNTIIAEWLNGRWQTDSTRYSVTTSRHQGYVRRAIAKSESHSCAGTDQCVYCYADLVGVRSVYA